MEALVACKDRQIPVVIFPAHDLAHQAWMFFLILVWIFSEFIQVSTGGKRFAV